MCRAIAELPNVSRVVGIDPSPEFVRLAESYAAGLDNVSYQLGAGTDLPFGDNSFDGVVMHTLLTHVADQPQVLAEAQHRLETGTWFSYLAFAGPHRQTHPIAGPPGITARRRQDQSPTLACYCRF